MTADPTWMAAESLFHEALEQNPCSRDRFLAQRCDGDTALREGVLRLLRGHGNAEPSFITPPEPANHTPGRIGRFRIVRLIASGGMGAVYEAEQDSPHRTVALKVLRAGMASPTLIRRFSQESEVLARLRHPGIAQVYEAGSFDDGTGPVPFFAMEFVPEARPITDFARALPTPQAIDLFLRVCDAVHHGHQRGIIHRDLKPGNILIDGAGAPKVIDFGIARAADSPAESMHTSAGQLIGTLAYMSSEQCAGDPAALDVRTDVYSLGIVLFELLCGRTPFDLADKPILEAARVIREQPPLRPSTITRMLRGDLETIVLTAIDRERDRRYQSVAEFAADIRRYRGNQTISARPATALYQLRKFARRNRALAAGAAVALVGLILGMAGTTWQAVRATDQRDRAIQAEARATETAAIAADEADTAKRIAACLQSAIAAMDPRIEAGRGTSPAAVLHQSAEAIARELKDKPLAQAALLNQLGEAYIGLGLPDRARTVLELAARTFETQDQVPPATLAAVHGNLASACRRSGDLPQSERIYRQILRSTSPGTAAFVRISAQCELCDMLLKRAELVEAQAFGEAAVREAAQSAEPGACATPRRILADVLEARGDSAGARVQYQLAIADSSTDCVMAALLRFRLGALEGRLGQAGAAATAFAAAAQTWQVGPVPRTAHAADICSDIGVLLEGSSCWATAETFLFEALERQIELVGPRHIIIADIRLHLAALMETMQRPQEAVPYYRDAVSILRFTVGDEHPDVGAGLYHLARIASAANEVPALRRLRDEADDLGRGSAKLPEAHPHRSGVLLLRGLIDMSLGDLDAAEAGLSDCIRLRQMQLGPDHKITVYAQTVLGGCLTRQGRFEEAEALLLAFVPRVEARYPRGSYMAADARQRLVSLYIAWGKPELAEAARQPAVAHR